MIESLKHCQCFIRMKLSKSHPWSRFISRLWHFDQVRPSCGDLGRIFMLSVRHRVPRFQNPYMTTVYRGAAYRATHLNYDGRRKGPCHKLNNRGALRPVERRVAHCSPPEILEERSEDNHPSACRKPGSPRHSWNYVFRGDSRIEPVAPCLALLVSRPRWQLHRHHEAAGLRRGTTQHD